jgi:hypothetical protein
MEAWWISADHNCFVQCFDMTKCNLANLTCCLQADDNAILQVLFDGGQVGNLKTEVFSAYFPEVNLGVFPAPQALVLCKRWLFEACIVKSAARQ